MTTEPKQFYFDRNGIKRTQRRSAAEIKAERNRIQTLCNEFEAKCRAEGVL